MSTSLVDLLKQTRDELYSYAQNEEMIDQYYTKLGQRCNLTANQIDFILMDLNETNNHQ